jgi:hypothetical protein
MFHARSRRAVQSSIPRNSYMKRPKGYSDTEETDRDEKHSVIAVKLPQEKEYAGAGGDGQQREELGAKVGNGPVRLARLLIDDLKRRAFVVGRQCASRRTLEWTLVQAARPGKYSRDGDAPHFVA